MCNYFQHSKFLLLRRRASQFVSVDMSITLVDTPAQLQNLGKVLASSSRIAVDVEWRPDGLFKSDGKSPASTLQLAVDGHGSNGSMQAFVIDLLQLNVRCAATLQLAACD